MLAEPILLDTTWITQALLLSQEAGWNQCAADWEIFLRHGAVFGCVAADRLVATAAALPYGDSFAWLSLVLVTSQWRRQGLATRLTAACTSLQRDAGRAVLLDANPAAVSIYKALGFLPLAALERWERPPGGQVSAVAPSYSGVDFDLDRFVFGADRRFLLENFLSRPGSRAFTTPRGFAILRQGASASQLGPIVAPLSEAPALMAEALQTVSGPVIVDVLDAAPVLTQTLIANNFRPLRRLTRMALGLTALPGNPSQLLAAAGPEFG